MEAGSQPKRFLEPSETSFLRMPLEVWRWEEEEEEGGHLSTGPPETDPPPSCTLALRMSAAAMMKVSCMVWSWPSWWSRREERQRERGAGGEGALRGGLWLWLLAVAWGVDLEERAATTSARIAW